ncbi:MAG: Mycothiol acetyltransferase [Anaerolineales bacterium]|nr:Mycothiol acetyltransferase [Anaerolineales bacterium]
MNEHVTGTRLEIEPVAESDIPAFRRMMVDYLTELVEGLRAGDVWSEADLEALRQEPNRWLCWASVVPTGVVDGERIGFVNLRVHEHWHDPSFLIGSVAEFYIRPSWRRQGYGRELAQRAIDFLWEQDVDQIELEVLYGNDRALAFWGVLGFEIAKYKLVLE